MSAVWEYNLVPLVESQPYHHVSYQIPPLETAGIFITHRENVEFYIIENKYSPNYQHW